MEIRNYNLELPDFNVKCAERIKILSQFQKEFNGFMITYWLNVKIKNVNFLIKIIKYKTI